MIREKGKGVHSKRSVFGLVDSIRHASRFINVVSSLRRRFARTFDLQEGFSLSEAVNDGSGKEVVWVLKIYKVLARLCH